MIKIASGDSGKSVHCPGIEPGSQEWESCMIPLHQQCWVAEECSLDLVYSVSHLVWQA